MLGKLSKLEALDPELCPELELDPDVLVVVVLTGALTEPAAIPAKVTVCIPTTNNSTPTITITNSSFRSILITFGD